MIALQQLSLLFPEQVGENREKEVIGPEYISGRFTRSENFVPRLKRESQ